MRRRLDDAQKAAGLPKAPDHRLTVGTFHSIALRHMRRYKTLPKLLSPAQQNLFKSEAMGEARFDVEASKALSQEFESYMYAIDRSALAISEFGMEMIQRYTHQLRASRATDLYTVMRDCALLCDRGEIPPLALTDMLVDEGQDTDELQKVWIFAHARAGTRVTIVGDDDQSIYEFRHALGFSGMKSFMETFSARRIELGDNFRCKQEILNPAVLMVSRNQARLQKRLVARRGKGGVSFAYKTASAETQCEELATVIASTPDAHQDSVVLARQNHSLNELEYALSEAGVDYVRIGKSVWDNPAVSNYLCMLQSLLDASPSGLMGSLALQQFDDGIRLAFLESMEGDASGFFAGEMPDLNGMTATDSQNFKAMAKVCGYWREQLQIGSVNEVCLGVGEWVADLHGKKEKPKALIRRCAGILGKLNGKLSSRLRFINENKKPKEKAPVTLMTMHGSKGLEFTTVHIIDANNPSDGSLLTEGEAERRLMYVAMTRAKNRCAVWFSDDPHPTLAEAKLTVKYNLDEVVKLLDAIKD